MLESLTALTNQFLEGAFLDRFNISRVIPIFKKDDPEILGNFRPIAIINKFSKILEMVIKRQTKNYFEVNYLLCNIQFDFLKNKSTIRALLRTIGDIVDIGQKNAELKS